MAHACIVCGRKIAKAIKFPAGKIYVCSERECRAEIELKITSGISVLGLDIETFENHNAACKEAVSFFKKDIKTLSKYAATIEELLWQGKTLGDLFHDAVKEVGIELEQEWIRRMKRTHLPLIRMEELEHDESRHLLEERLKGE